MFYKQDKKETPVFYNQEKKPLWDLFHNQEENPEYNLFESSIVEFNDLEGFPVNYYVKLNINESDYLYGELPNSEYSAPYPTKLVYKPTEEKIMLDVFGIRGDDIIEGVFIAKHIWNRDVYNKIITESYDFDLLDKPKVGDLIETKWNNMLFEITFIGEEEKIFQAKKMVYNFILRNFRYSEEDDDQMLNKETDFDNIFKDIEDRESEEYGNNTEIGEEAKEDYDYSNKDTKKLYGYEVL